jgi:hypothetical protein
MRCMYIFFAVVFLYETSTNLINCSQLTLTYDSLRTITKKKFLFISIISYCLYIYPSNYFTMYSLKWQDN